MGFFKRWIYLIISKYRMRKRLKALKERDPFVY